ncbi:Peptide deformylase [Halomicronema hongdechloris C2206]|uniref:Peptide deformylase n=1 Tax=Halomicronema hongdechloris C2206 TaxID=1641165 RepID=A0A1Z3HUA4_9CYAN|nr:peptide deformylase [Halomicronema hongdechloris]ASC73898.1 Peptide deformylase [Halomicronema hongdechloris C2206]
MSPSTILQLGHPCLRQVAAPVDHVEAPQIQRLIDDLLTTTTATHGVGIAAPQVGESCQVVIIASHPNPRYPEAPAMKPMALINPQIVAHSDEVVSGWEGCLSVPGRRGVVWRYRQVEVAYLDRWGREQQREFSDFVARIVQHEVDHLQGKVFLDRVKQPQDVLDEQTYWQRR